MDGSFDVHEWCLYHSDILLSFFEGKLFKISYFFVLSLFWISKSARKLWRRDKSKIQFETIWKNFNSKSVWFPSWNFRRISPNFKCGRNHGLLLGWRKSGPRLGWFMAYLANVFLTKFQAILPRKSRDDINTNHAFQSLSNLDLRFILAPNFSKHQRYFLEKISNPVNYPN